MKQVFEMSPEAIEANTFIRERMIMLYGEKYMENKKVEIVYDEKEHIWTLNVYDINMVLQ